MSESVRVEGLWSEPVGEPERIAATVPEGTAGPSVGTGSAVERAGERGPTSPEQSGVDQDPGAVRERSFQRRPRGTPRRGRRLVSAAEAEQARTPFTPEQRLLVLDSWQRSGLPAGDFAPLVGVSKHTLYAWKKQFTEHGPAGLAEHPRGAPQGSRLPELTKRTILLLKQTHPEWGCERISDMLVRGPALPASPGAVRRVLAEAGYQLEEIPTRPHPDQVRSFERARPNQLWQTDLFTFILKRQNRRVYLVAFQDDHSRFIVSHGLYASPSSALVLEVLRAGIDAYGPPEEVLTDNGSQYVTWRGKSAFTKELEKRGIRQIVARPRRPQTLGKIERFWGTLWRECVETAVFVDLADARRRIGLFLDYYNFQRGHSSLEGLVPADRYFGAASDVLRTLQARVAANALELARQGVPKAPFYMTGQVGGQSFSLHAEGERVILTRAGSPRQEVDLTPPVEPVGEPSPELTGPPATCPEPVSVHGAPLDGVAEEMCDVVPAPGVSALEGVPVEEGESRAGWDVTATDCSGDDGVSDQSAESSAVDDLPAREGGVS